MKPNNSGDNSISKEKKSVRFSEFLVASYCRYHRERPPSSSLAEPLLVAPTPSRTAATMPAPSSSFTKAAEQSRRCCSRSLEGGGDDSECRRRQQCRRQRRHYRFNCWGAALGFLIGFFLHFATLGANLLMYKIREEQQLQQNYHHREGTNDNSNVDDGELKLSGVVWPVVASCMAAAIMYSLRRLVAVAYEEGLQKISGYGGKTTESRRRNQRQQRAATTKRKTSSFEESALARMEWYFVVGALSGVFAAWALSGLATRIAATNAHRTAGGAGVFSQVTGTISHSVPSYFAAAAAAALSVLICGAVAASAVAALCRRRQQRQVRQQQANQNDDDDDDGKEKDVLFVISIV